MAKQAVYKNMTSDYRNMDLMQAVGIALSGWRESYGANEYGEFDDACLFPSCLYEMCFFFVPSFAEILVNLQARKQNYAKRYS